MRSLEQFLIRSKADVDAMLDVLIPAVDVEPKRLHEAIRWSTFAGGKRIRPAILLAVGETFQCPRQKLLRTAAAIEMVHTYSLIHDDLPSMDNDDLRRGRATCHKKFDEATAILAGDVLQTLAFKTIADDDSISARTRVDLLSMLATALGTPLGMASGQQLDLEAEGKPISIDEVEKIHRQKTGALISASASAGALIAGARKREMSAVRDYAEKLGLLFQITDDLLDVTQKTEDLGKTAGKDAASNKATYPSHLGVDGTRELARSIFEDCGTALLPIHRDTTMLTKIASFVLDRSS